MSGGKKYQHLHEQVILCLLSEPTAEAAASKAGISPATMTRWLARPDFQEQYRLARRRMFESSLSRLQTLAGKAVSTLETALTSGKVSTQVRAAEIILLHGKEAALTLDLMTRLDQLETLMTQKATP